MEDALFNAGKTKTAKEQIANPLIEDGLKLVPSVTRVFSKSRDMYVYVQGYERDAGTTDPLVAFITFYKGQDKVFETSSFAVTGGLEVKSKAVPLKFTVPLRDLAPGSVRLSGQRSGTKRAEGRGRFPGRPVGVFTGSPTRTSSITAEKNVRFAASSFKRCGSCLTRKATRLFASPRAQGDVADWRARSVASLSG
jgi:hypothetical protein